MGRKYSALTHSYVHLTGNYREGLWDYVKEEKKLPLIPFTTHFSSGLGSIMEKMQNVASGAEILPSISV